MSKKLLNEAAVRRFMGLAGMSGNIVSNAINEMYGDMPEEEEAAVGEELPAEDAELPPDDMGGEEMPMDDEPPMEDDLMAGVPEESKEAVGKAVMQAVADALGLDVDISGAEGEEAPMEIPDEAPEEELPPEESEMMQEGEDEIEEALAGVTTDMTEEEIVKEVSRRVAKRILKAKKAHKNLKEALGTK